MLKVSVVIPNYNGQELLEKNLPKVIEASRNKKNEIKEIIVVDDVSSDRSVELIKNRWPKEVRLIKHKINRGFASTVNTGARMATGSLIVLLNTDVYPEKDFLAEIFKHFERKEIFAVSLHEAGYGWARGVFREGFIEHEPGSESQEFHQTFWVSGGSGVFRRDIWMKLGGMDEKLLSPLYWEDVDLSYRAAKRGYRLLWEPRARVVHEHEATVKKLPVSFTNLTRQRNQLLLIWKNLTSPILFRKHLVGLAKRVIRNPGYLKIVLASLPKLPALIKARSKEKKETKISDEAIFAKFT